MTEAIHNVLLVDDDEELCQLLCEYLQTQGLSTRYLTSAETALKHLQEGCDYSVLVLDIMMPGMDGLDLLKLIRQKLDVPVIMLTGKGDDIDRIIGLELGADDYLGKPCNPRELAARIKAILRRAQASTPKMDGHSLSKGGETLKVLGLALDSGSLQACVQDSDEALNLTGVEFKVLYLLAQNLGQTISKEYLCEGALNRKLDAYDRSIDVHISRIRNKLAEQAGLSNSIKSVRGVGYQLVKSKN